MQLIKFLSSDTLSEEFKYSGQYAYRLGIGLIDRKHALYTNRLDCPERILLYDSMLICAQNGVTITYNDTINSIDSVIQLISSDENIFIANQSFEDSYLTAKISDKTVLITYNEALSKRYLFSIDDYTQPVKTIGKLIYLNLSEEMKSHDVIKWLISNKYDDICKKLSVVDTNQTITNLSGCECNKAYIAQSDCSTLEKYSDYMNMQTVSFFRNIEYLHKIFMHKIDGVDVPNQELIKKFILFAEGLIVSPMMAKGFSCPCTTINIETSTIISSIKTALSLLGTNDECKHETFITYWLSKYIEYVLKLK